MLAPDSRALLLDALRPPAGHPLQHAVATTFTLDLETALMVPLAFAGFQFDEQPDPIEMMESLRRMSERIDIFYQAGAISSRGWPSDLLALLEDVVHGVRRPRPGHIFHPKVWALRYLDQSGDPLYRLLVLSRNLTADRSWDTLLWLDGRPDEQDGATNAPLTRFISALPGLAVMQLTPERQDRLIALAGELNRVSWDRPEGVRQVRFHPIGLPGAPPFPVEEHFAGYRKLVVSPYVRDGVIRRILRPRRGEEGVLVSRGAELAALEEGSTEHLEVYELDPMASLSGDDREENEGRIFLTYLHAKIFAVERARLAHLFVGSANATDAAFSGGNIEFLCELIGPVARFGVKALVGEDAGFRAMLTPYAATEGTDSDEAGTVARQLGDLLFDIAGEVRFRTIVSRGRDGWEVHVRTDTALPEFSEGTTVTLATYNRPAVTRELTSAERVDTELKPRELADITPFLLITARRAVRGGSLNKVR